MAGEQIAFARQQHVRRVDADLQVHGVRLVGAGDQAGIQTDFGNVEGAGNRGLDGGIFLVAFVGVAGEGIVTLLGLQADTFAGAGYADFVILAVPPVEWRIESDQVAHAGIAGRLGDGSGDIDGAVGAPAGETGELFEGFGAGHAGSRPTGDSGGERPGLAHRVNGDVGAVEGRGETLQEGRVIDYAEIARAAADGNRHSVADPNDAFAAGSFGHPGSQRLQRVVGHADAVVHQVAERPQAEEFAGSVSQQRLDVLGPRPGGASHGGFGIGQRMDRIQIPVEGQNVEEQGIRGLDVLQGRNQLVDGVGAVGETGVQQVEQNHRGAREGGAGTIGGLV